MSAGYVIVIVYLTTVGFLETFGEQPDRSCSRFDFEEKLLEKLVRMEIKLNETEIKLNERLTTMTPKVAFRAQLSYNIGTVSTGKVIVFDEVDLNLGSAYSARHGYFTAPYDGTYQFSMVLGNPTGKPGAFFMKKNGDGIGYSIAGHTTGWNIGGVTTVASLFVGDEVWIEGEGHISGAYATDRYHTGFSGVLVNAY